MDETTERKVNQFAGKMNHILELLTRFGSIPDWQEDNDDYTSLAADLHDLGTHTDVKVAAKLFKHISNRYMNGI